MTTPCQPTFQLPPCQRSLTLVCLSVPGSAEIVQALQVRNCADSTTYESPTFLALDGLTSIPDGASRLVDCPRQIMSNPGGVLGAAKRVLYEAAFPYSYYGIALPGSATGDPVWTIVRSFTNAGITTLGSVSGVTWTGRVTHTYT